MDLNIAKIDLKREKNPWEQPTMFSVYTQNF
jgi:hypothetical protein